MMKRGYDKRKGLGIKFLFLILGMMVTGDAVGKELGIQVLLYHRVGEEARYPTTSVSVAQFAMHMEKLSGFEVVGGDVAMRMIREGVEVEKPTVVITFDDGFRSIREKAWKILEEKGYPFTVFVNSGVHENPGDSYMTWQEMKEMGSLLTVGSHGKSHESFLSLDSEGKKRLMREDVRLSEERWGKKPLLFSYPYGEVGEEGESLVEEMGFLAGFGQHSGVVGVRSDRFFLPRFSLNVRYGSEERFDQILRTVPFYVELMDPKSRVVEEDVERIVVKMEGGLKRSPRCFGGGHSLSLEEGLGIEEVRMELKGLLGGERYRVNCTYREEGGEYGWGGLMLFVR